MFPPELMKEMSRRIQRNIDRKVFEAAYLREGIFRATYTGPIASKVRSSLMFGDVYYRRRFIMAFD